ncbi:hypothetical protein D3C76_1125970 [compost metagenome]
MLGQLRRAGGNPAGRQVSRAGTGNTHHVGQGRGHQTGIGQGTCAQHQIDFAQVRAVQVDKAVDQAQLHIEPGVGHQKVGDGRSQMAAAERCRRVDADQALRGIAQRHCLGARQAQFFDDAPGPFGKGVACRCRTHGVGAAYEQAAADSIFQGIDAPCHGGWGQWMAAGGGGKATGFQYIQKQTELFGEGVGVHFAGPAFA